MPTAQSSAAPVARETLTAEQRARLMAALMDLAEMPTRRRLLAEYEQECDDAMLAELPRGRK